MRTPAFIGIEGVMVDSDGYPDLPHGAGNILLFHYPDPHSARRLISGGDLRTLAPETGGRIKTDLGDFVRSGANHRTCCFYHMPDDGPEPKGRHATRRVKDRQELRETLKGTYCPYAYLLTPDGWMVCSTGEFSAHRGLGPQREYLPLTQAITAMQNERERECAPDRQGTRAQ